MRRYHFDLVDTKSLTGVTGAIHNDNHAKKACWRSHATRGARIWWDMGMKSRSGAQIARRLLSWRWIYSQEGKWW
jgi:hypothetical protein